MSEGQSHALVTRLRCMACDCGLAAVVIVRLQAIIFAMTSHDMRERLAGRRPV